MIDSPPGNRWPARLLALGVAGHYIFLAGFVVLCLAHHDPPRDHGEHHDRPSEIEWICTWAQQTASSYAIPENAGSLGLTVLAVTPFSWQSYYSAPLIHLSPIRAPPATLS